MLSSIFSASAASAFFDALRLRLEVLEIVGFRGVERVLFPALRQPLCDSFQLVLHLDLTPHYV